MTHRHERPAGDSLRGHPPHGRPQPGLSRHPASARAPGGENGAGQNVAQGVLPADLPEPRTEPGRAAALSAAVAALQLSLALVRPDGSISYASEGLSALLGLPRGRAVRGRLGDLVPALREREASERLRRVVASGGECTLRLEQVVGATRRTVAVRATRTSSGQLALEFRGVADAPRPGDAGLAEALEENALLHELARRLADTPDSAALLRVLCEIVLRECAATGAGVGAVRGGEVEVLASIGHGLHASGTTFPLAGSLAARVVAARELVSQVAAELPEAVPGRPDGAGEGAGVRQVMLAPLVAHDQVIGVLLAAREPDGPRFSARDERRLGLVADHVALALFKSRLLDQTLAASEARSNFLATVSHELRTPLTALTGYGELLADQIVGPLGAGQLEMVERMRSVTQELTAMVDELLTFSSLESGRELLRVGEVAAGDLLQAAVAVVEPAARQKGLSIQVSVPADAPSIVTDPDKVRQVLVNVAGNAVKFTDRGHILLALESDASEVRFIVHDTGPGIPPGSQERIFQPFVQLDGGLTRRHGGTGLGLYIASRLAGLLGGRIELSSRKGEGSSFTLVLPREASR